MKQKQFFILIFVLLSGLSCHADNGAHGFPKAWEKWRAKLEKDSGNVIAYSVKREWVIYNKHLSGTDSQWVRNMRKKKDWEIDLTGFDTSALPTVNIDTCKTNYTIQENSQTLNHISPDGRAVFRESSNETKDITYISLETGKSKELSNTLAWHALEGLGGMTGFESDSVFYTWETVFCDKKGEVAGRDETMQDGMNLLDFSWFIHTGKVYKDYYRKVRYNTKGEKMSVGKLVRSSKMMEEYWRNSNDTLSLTSWKAELCDKNGSEIADSAVYYHRQDEWADAVTSKPYTRAAVLYLEKQRWGNQNEVPQDAICEGETKYYLWMPVMCDAQGRIASDDAIFPNDSYSIESKIIDVKDVEDALRTGKIQYRYRRMWHEYSTYNNHYADQKYLGSDAKLYTKAEVVAIDKNHFRWPDEW